MSVPVPEIHNQILSSIGSLSVTLERGLGEVRTSVAVLDGKIDAAREMLTKSFELHARQEKENERMLTRITDLERLTLTRIQECQALLDKRHEEIDDRLRRVSEKNSWFMGAVAAGATILSFVVPIIATVIGRKLGLL